MYNLFYSRPIVSSDYINSYRYIWNSVTYKTIPRTFIRHTYSTVIHRNSFNSSCKWTKNATHFIFKRLNMCIVIADTPQQSLVSGPNIGMWQKMDHVWWPEGKISSVDFWFRFIGAKPDFHKKKIMLCVWQANACKAHYELLERE